MKYKLKSFDSAIQTGVKPGLSRIDLNTTSLKYASMKFAMSHSNEFIQSVLSQAPIAGDRKYVVVDVKIHDLEADEIPALSNWHIDCITHPLHPAREERNHLLVVGECLTEFLKEEIEVDLLEYPALQAKFDLAANVAAVKIPRGEYVTYGRLAHRASVCNAPERRLLIRVTESDVLAPRNEIFKVYKQRKRNENT